MRAAAVVAAVAVGVSVSAVGLVAGPRSGAPPGGVVAARGATTPEGAGSADDGSLPGAPGAVPARAYAPPLDAPLVVVRDFDGPPQPWAAGHRGVDLAADPGQTVRAPQGGVVTFAGTVVDRGVVTVTHDDGLRSSLEPVRWSVGLGQRVVQGQVVGSVSQAAGHCAPATCLHWGLRRGESYLDPMRWVTGRGPIVLLPER
ncbi:M23 family metallopeptidase [uncultured Cellulomonas sp.]|uniref:M23 family metallopeptidase n=1 Tax=uncultured Cellulomonas sp. TaxID=189682 RepID=UPI0026216A6F|nr:M23 family metallopeptidase [uncultured Cellulomonas sp.]